LHLIILPGKSLLNAPVPCFEYLCRFAVAGEWANKMDAVEPVFGDDDEEGMQQVCLGILAYPPNFMSRQRVNFNRSSTDIYSNSRVIFSDCGGWQV
jgi:hypothetical protein